MTVAGISKRIRKYKNKKPKAFYTITYRDMFGKQHTSGYYETEAEAKKHLNDFDYVNPEVIEITFEQIFNPYIENQLTKYSHTTQATYNLYIDKILSELYPLKYDKVSTIALQKFIDNIEKVYSPYVAQLCLKIARAVCNYSVKHKRIKENKFLAVNNVVVSPKGSEHLTEAQEKEILKSCKELYPKYYAFFCTLMGTGMRIGEVFALEVSDIDFENRYINVNKQFTKGKFKNGTKNRAGIVKVNERKVYITNDIIAVLKEHIKSLPEGAKILFPSQVNGYLSDTNIRRRVWQPLLTYVGITDRVRLHDLRGSYVDIAINNGASIKFVQNQLGHHKAETTLNVYAKNNKDMIDKALGEIDGKFIDSDM